jgi:hypothetical protein
VTAGQRAVTAVAVFEYAVDGSTFDVELQLKPKGKTR